MCYYRESIVAQILNIHHPQAETLVQETASELVKEAFNQFYNNINHQTLAVSTASEKIDFNPTSIMNAIDKWSSDLDYCLENEKRIFNRMEKTTPEDEIRIFNMEKDILLITGFYKDLKQDIEEIELDFANVARAYRSPIHQALNDISILYNEIEDETGPFSKYNDVSIYMHGIEDDGKGFLESAKAAAQTDDIIVHKKRNGDIEYYYKLNDNEPPKKMSYEQLKERGLINGRGRFHLVYEADQKNEHRQETSDNLAEYLIDQGLLDNDTKIDLFGHSYGGRRSLQFAVDFPDHVRSITTIGTPYDKNNWAFVADHGANLNSKIPEIFNKHPSDFSDYLDFNPDNSRTDKGVEHSNSYTDMKNEAMVDTLDNLSVANPEVYEKLYDIDITTVAGRDYSVQPSGLLGTTKRYDTHDGAVSVKSQHGEALEDLVDERLSFEIRGNGLLDPAHGYQIEDPEFIKLIRDTNISYDN